MTPLVQACPVSQCAWCRALRQQGNGHRAYRAALHLVVSLREPGHRAALLTLYDFERTTTDCEWTA